MERRIRERFSDRILREAGRRYDIAEEHIRLLDGFESFIYEFDRAGQAGILRIGHSLRRTPALIQAEVDWIHYLAEGGAGVARALRSTEGNLVEAVDDEQGTQFLVTAFARAPGKKPGENEWTPALFERYGRLIGRMHALSRTFTPPHPECVRYHWDADENMSVEQFLPQEDAAMAEEFGTLLTHLRTLPRDPGNYGLIHQDAHGGNFFVDDGGRLTLFDFDDCCYGHFAYDLAMVVFYAIANRPDMPAATRKFLPSFLEGYGQESPTNPGWFEAIPHFLKLREIDLYAVIHRSMGAGPYGDHPWIGKYMAGRRERLLARMPFVEVDFTAFR